MRFYFLLLCVFCLACNIGSHKATATKPQKETEIYLFDDLVKQFDTLSLPLEAINFLGKGDVNDEYFHQYFKPDYKELEKEDQGDMSFSLIGKFYWKEYVLLFINESIPRWYNNHNDLYVFSKEGQRLDSLVLWREGIGERSVTGIINEDKTIVLRINEGEEMGPDKRVDGIRTYQVGDDGHFVETKVILWD